MTIRTLRYGRMLEDFEVGATYPHPWEVTVDGGTIALYQASFLDATPTYASARFARALGLRERPVHPLLLMNLGLSFSVHDVSEQAIAHLTYENVRFPMACYPGDTVSASSKVLGKKHASSGDRGVVHVRTLLETGDGVPVCIFERKALVRANQTLDGRREAPFVYTQPEVDEGLDRPEPLRRPVPSLERRGGFAGFLEDFAEGDVYYHGNGKTVSEGEHMQLTLLMRNSHPLHFDEGYCREGHSFTGTRVVYGGLVFALVASLASRDMAGNALWDLGWDKGAHPAGVAAGDTIYAASKVLGVRALGGGVGEVTSRLVGLRNLHPETLGDPDALFLPERDKPKDRRIPQKVFEITRRLLVLARPL